MKLADHPTVKVYREQGRTTEKHEVLETAVLKQAALDAGADAVGVVDLARESMSEYRQDMLDVMPDTGSIMVLAFRVNQVPLRSRAHAVANHEFQQTWARSKTVQSRLVDRLKREGVPSVAMPVGFPMEMERWPNKMWLTCDKVFAVEAGLGQMGYNRLVLHPEFGASVVFGTVLLSGDCDAYDAPIDYNPCIQCGLCLKVCPTGAVKRTDDFDFSACFTHNYRERLGGFLNWVEQLADSKNASDYRKKVSDSETFSMWQNLSIGGQTRCDRCMAICPAGKASIGEYLDDRKAFNQYRDRFNSLAETIYAVKGSDAAQHVGSKFPQKKLKYVSNGLHPLSAAMFVESMPRVFQPNQSEGINAVYHFSFTGSESLECTVAIKEKRLTVQTGLKGKADLHVTADSDTWVKFLAKEANLLLALLTRKIRIKGSPKLMKDFGRCFPP
jgi:epoxyqueuosine reductase QueG